MKLYSGPLSMFGAKAEIAALEKGLDVELIMVPFEMKTLYQPKHPEVLRINPKRQVPVLIDGDLELFDSTQIFEYFETVKPEPALWPAEAKERARARLLEHKSDEIYFPPIVRLMALQATPDDSAAVERDVHHAVQDHALEALDDVVILSGGGTAEFLEGVPVMERRSPDVPHLLHRCHLRPPMMLGSISALFGARGS